jgi:hypothetical protein
VNDSDEGTDPNYRRPTPPPLDERPTQLGAQYHAARELTHWSLMEERSDDAVHKLDLLDRHLVAHHHVVREMGATVLWWLRILVVARVIGGAAFLGMVAAGITVALLR